jgi:hypothetical protein
MARFIAFMKGTWGRLARIVLGLALVALGLAVLGGTTGLVLTAVGLVPIALALSGYCVLDLVAGSHPRTPAGLRR